MNAVESSVVDVPRAHGTRFGVLGLIVLSALLGGLLLAGSARAANPSIINTGTGCAGQTSWLVTCAASGESGNSSNIMRMSALVSHDADKSIPSLLTDDDWDGTSFNSTNVRSVSAQRPSIASGYPRSRANLTYTLPTSNTGMSCSAPFGGTRRTTDRVARLRARDSANQDSTASASQIKFVATGSCTGPEDYAYLYGWGGGNFGNTVTPGTSLSFTYNGDDTDTTGSADFQGINWRWRNLRTGATTASQVSCPNNGDNAVKTLNTNAPNARGAYVLEAELLDGGGCGDNQNPGFWFAIATVDVNSSSIPAPGLTATRPQINGNTTITLDPPDDPDSASGGGVQIIQWDLDQNTGNGVSGFETDTVAGEGNIITANQTKTINTTGMAPGLHTVRARVIDNGAMDAADSIRRTSSIASTTFRVDSPPVAQAQTVSTEQGDPKDITLSAVDADGDTLTYTIQTPPSNGSLSGSGAERTYTPDPGFAGTDSFSFQVSDGFGGTDTKTVTVNVTPQTQIDSGPNGTSNDASPSFEFSSPASGTSFECRLDDGDWEACASPEDLTDLADGEHTFQARAVKGALTDPTPASRTFTVDTTAPETTIDSGPAEGSTQSETMATFAFSADEPSSFECKFDDGGWESCISPAEYTGLDVGEHTFQVRASDIVGNTDQTPASRTFTIAIDFEAPTTTDDVPAAWQKDDVTVTLTADDGPDGTGVDATYYEAGANPDDPTTSSAVYDPQNKPVLGDGERIKYFSVDVAGNEESVKTSAAAKVDKQAPTTTDDVPAAWQKDDVTVTLDAQDTGGSGVDATYYETGNDPDDPTTSSAVYDPQNKPVLGDGERIKYFSVDVAGNEEIVKASAAAKVDKDAPTTTDDVPATWQKNDVTVTLTANDTGGSGVDATYYEVGASPEDPTTSSPVYDPGDKPKLGDGERIKYFTVDVAGNEEAVKTSAAAQVDEQAPTTTDDVPTTWQNNDVTVTLSANDTGGSGVDATYYEVGASPANPTTASAVYDPANKPVLTNGQRIKYFSVDVAGNEEAVKTSPAAQVDKLAPATTDNVPATWQKNDVTVTLSASDTGGSGVDKTYYTVGTSPPDPTTASAVYDPANKPVLTNGQRIKYFSTDVAGNAEAVKTSPAAQVDKLAPTTTDNVPASGWQQANVTVTLTATDTGGSGLDKTYYTLGANPPDPTTSSSVYNPAAKPVLTNGQRIKYFSTDVAGNAEAVKTSPAVQVDGVAPTTTDDVPAAWRKNDVIVTLSASDAISGVSKTYYTIGTSPATPTTSSPVYDPANKPRLQNGERIRYFSVDVAGNAEAPKLSVAAQVDKQQPTTTDNVPAAWQKDDFRVTLTATDAGGAGIDRIYYTVGANPADPTFTSSIYDPANKPLLTDGQRIKYLAVDLAGNSENVKTSAAVKVDKNVPATTDDVPAGWRTSDVTVTLTAGDTGGSGLEATYYEVGASPANPTTSSAVYNPASKPVLTDGQRIKYFSTDAAGNAEAVKTSPAVQVDKVAPETSDDVPSGWQDAEVTVTLSAADARSGVSKTYYETGASPADPTTSSPVYDPGGKPTLGNGERIKYFSVDVAGNAEAVKSSQAAEVDAEAPETTDDVPAGWRKDDVTVTLTATDDGSGVAATYYETGTDPDDPTDASPEYDPQNKPVLADGERIKYFSVDELGRVEDVRTSSAAKVDKEVPETTDDVTGDLVGQPVTVTLTASDTGGSGVEATYYETGTSPAAPTTSSPVYDAGDKPALGNGERIRYFTVDAAGNAEEPKLSQAANVDDVAPETSINSGRSGSSTDRSATFTFSSSKGGTRFECKLDGGPFESCTSPKRYEGLSVGLHTFQVRAIDQFDNADPTPASRTFTVRGDDPPAADTRAPVTKLTKKVKRKVKLKGAKKRAKVKVAFAADEPSTFQCRLDGKRWKPCKSPAKLKLRPGRHTFEVVATDTAGNVQKKPLTVKVKVVRKKQR